MLTSRVVKDLVEHAILVSVINSSVGKYFYKVYQRQVCMDHICFKPLLMSVGSMAFRTTLGFQPTVKWTYFFLEYVLQLRAL